MKSILTLFITLMLSVCVFAQCGIENCETCTPAEVGGGDKCSKCATGYTLQADKCEHCPYGCNTCKTGTSAKELLCTACGDGFYMSNNSCLECSTFCKFCSGPLETDCTVCISGSTYNPETKLCEPFSQSVFIWIFASVGIVIFFLCIALVWNCVKKAQEDKERPPPIDPFKGLNEANIGSRSTKKKSPNKKNKVGPNDRNKNFKNESSKWELFQKNQASSPRGREETSPSKSPFQPRPAGLLAIQSPEQSTHFQFAPQSQKQTKGASSSVVTAVSDQPGSGGL